jgi:hypothetical protein
MVIFVQICFNRVAFIDLMRNEKFKAAKHPTNSELLSYSFEGSIRKYIEICFPVLGWLDAGG